MTGVGPSTMSFADTTKLIGAPLGPVAPALIVPGSVSTGGRVSTTETTKLSADAPPGDVAVQPTVVSPTPNVDPDAGEQTTVASELEVAVNVTAAPAPLVASAVMSFGTMSVGAVAPPVTVTRNVPETLLAFESVAVQLTMVDPTAKVEP